LRLDGFGFFFGSGLRDGFGFLGSHDGFTVGLGFFGMVRNSATLRDHAGLRDGKADPLSLTLAKPRDLAPARPIFASPLAVCPNLPRGIAANTIVVSTSAPADLMANSFASFCSKPARLATSASSFCNSPQSILFKNYDYV
jgi:hypothetical protein